jgi:hypothetical protein
MTGCWIWPRAKDHLGYGVIWDPKQKRQVKAHRYYYELFISEVPEGIKVLHHCDNPSCYNPRHLFLGTQKDNMQDCVKKGRLKSKGKAKLTQAMADEIRRRYSRGINQNQRGNKNQLAEEFGITPLYILDLVRGRRW